MTLTSPLQAELDQFKQDGVYNRQNTWRPLRPRAYVWKDGARRHPVVQQLPRSDAMIPKSSARASGRWMSRPGRDPSALSAVPSRSIGSVEAALAKPRGLRRIAHYVSCWTPTKACARHCCGRRHRHLGPAQHASIIDFRSGSPSRSAKCQTAVYRHSDMADLERSCARQRAGESKLVVTDGIFSMEGEIANCRTLSHCHDSTALP